MTATMLRVSSTRSEFIGRKQMQLSIRLSSNVYKAVDEMLLTSVVTMMSSRKNRELWDNVLMLSHRTSS